MHITNVSSTYLNEYFGLYGKELNASSSNLFLIEVFLDKVVLFYYNEVLRDK